jgi:uncharacterized protein Yka (UPF0111/DUF47 family)
LIVLACSREAAMKSEIIEQLGQTDILLPSLIADGLSANDRVKARLSVLQAAGRHALDPNRATFDLAEECRSAGLDPVAIEALVNRAQLLAGERVIAPGLSGLQTAVWDDVMTMIRAVKAGDKAEGTAALERLSAIKAANEPESVDTLTLARIAALTGVSGGDDAQLHRLVMDLHKRLNGLALTHAEEVLAGAHVYGLLPEDRSAIEAFMRGVNSTRKLKFSHPGLATTAMRSGTRLTIQNDIGETDAHVVVITVEADAVTVIYTDVHLPRVKFFIGLLRDFPGQWSGLDRKSAQGLGDDGAFYLVTGRYPTDDHRDAFLEAVGASLVFLIDWNRARKLLRTWVSKSDAIDVLYWAACNRIGHRGFLELGGGELVASAVRRAAPNRIGFGERLDHALGRDAAVDFLRTVLRVSAEALLEGSAVRLARDRIEADLICHLQRVDTALLAVVIRQSGLAREIAAGIADCIAEQKAGSPFDRGALADRARRIEEKADKMAIETRSEIARLGADLAVKGLIDRMEDAIDELEQAAFVASIVPNDVAPQLLGPLARLCATVVSGTEAAATGVAAAADVPEGHRADSEDALAAVGRLIDVEHRADDIEREVMGTVMHGEFNLKTALSVIDLTRTLERATDRLASFGHLLREHVLADLTN